MCQKSKFYARAKIFIRNDKKITIIRIIDSQKGNETFFGKVRNSRVKHVFYRSCAENQPDIL